ncbi:30S ribosomal protein S3 [Eubacteriales bacterium OttesenSCG-928-M02]|nr:30S ribosomal protein S3 [Eubacteriales bacterium OttesenSCG-928-M02]
MGQKVHPHGFRVGVIKDWDTRWFANKKDFADFLVEDYQIREFLKEKLYAAGISKIEIERAVNKVTVNIHTGKPGVVIGRGGSGVEVIKGDLTKLTGKSVNVNIIEVKNVDINAQLMAENVASQLERRISFRRAMKQTITRAMRAGAKGVKMTCSGRLGGAEIARSESYHEGSIPLQTLRADIDYGFSEAKTTYGRIGVKVWVYRGEVLGGRGEAVVEEPQQNRRNNRRRNASEGGND